MRTSKDMLKLIQLGWIVGFEGEGSGESGSDDGSTDGDDGDDDDDSGDGDDKGDDDKGEGDGDGNEGLKRALAAERAANKKNSRELKKLRRAQEEAGAKDKTEVEQATEKATKAEEKAAKLATRLRKEAVDNLITKHASKLKFRDIDDALALINRGDIEVDQDEDDPDEIEVDEATVVAALTALKTKKPHLIAVDGEGNSTGHSGAGRTGGNKGEMSEEELKTLYPSLR